MTEDQAILSDIRCLFMDKLDANITEISSRIDEMERLFNACSDEMRRSDNGQNIYCDLQEIWSAMAWARGISKSLRYYLEQGHDNDS